MGEPFPYQLDIQLELALALGEAAVKGARALAAAAPNRKRRRCGQTVKPGAETPLWNALASAIEAQLKRRGERVRLARVLGWPRQRVTDMLRTRSRQPDAERTLLLLVWLNARRRGGDLG